MGNGTANWDFSGRVVVVTNAGLERGLAQVDAFADVGATVIACIARSKGSKHIGSELDEREAVTPIELDLSDEPSVADVAKRIEDGPGRLDALVLNDGDAADSPLLDLPIDAWRTLVDDSLTAPFLYAKHLLPIMARARYGKIVLTTGPESSSGVPGRAHVVAIRHAIAGFAKDLAIEAADDQINANVVEAGAPGGDLNSEAALASLTRSVMWLCSDASRFVTGSVVGGGTTPLARFAAP